MAEKQFSVDAARKITANEIYGRIKTRDGHPVRIICWKAKSIKPIVALVDFGAYEQVCMYTKDGKFDVRENVTSNFDLIIETEGGEA
jgi:hypothetical protein